MLLIEMEASDWSKLSESAGARTNATLAAAERIRGGWGKLWQGQVFLSSSKRDLGTTAPS
jgi:hypothetical protein